ncbi:hypothetical protein HU200_041365 [Digitaria exilis]|uniref:Uncharacterized protein n=1 Tax=Digitaria exilis TaxID=1010633 RepID=A0A835EJ98_9POAL|nr:hypothetical protein HU200_041365 [Digitaria exilis]
MTSLLQMSPFAVSAAAAAEQKPVEEKYSSGSIPRNDENYIAPAEPANSKRGSTQDQEKIINTKSSRKRRMEDADEASDKELGSYPSLNMFAKTWLWDRLVPLRCPTGWSDYSNYLRHFGSTTIAMPVLLVNKEADLICELLKHGANRTDCIIEQSIMIRMCALSLMLSILKESCFPSSKMWLDLVASN